jgi:hypothetical protein
MGLGSFGISGGAGLEFRNSRHESPCERRHGAQVQYRWPVNEYRGEMELTGLLSVQVDL